MNTTKITYKSLTLFHLAAISLLICGIILSSNKTILSTLLLVWCCFCGVFAVYRLNDFIDSEENLKNNLIHFFKNKLNLIFTIQFFLITLPLSYFILPFFTFVVLAASGLLGALYSIKFHFGKTVFRIKNTIVLKNGTIGLSWGAIVLIGAGDFSDPLVQSIVVFTVIQVFIGSVIRDIPDVEKDVLNKVRSFPIVFGIRETISLMIILNLISIVSIFLSPDSINLWITFILVSAWRLLTLLGIMRDYSSKFWSQTANLLTCTLLLCVFFLTTLFYEI